LDTLSLFSGIQAEKVGKPKTNCENCKRAEKPRIGKNQRRDKVS
jgi:hypothetical protein